MKSETDPITDDEWLLRRIWHERFRPDQLGCVVSPNAFAPRLRGPKVREPDIDGISLYRLSCLSTAEDVLTPVRQNRRHLYAVVRIPASFVRSLKLTLQPLPDPHVKGQVVIPELNADDYERDSKTWLPVLLKLAEEAGRPENILIRPKPNSD